MRWNAKFAATAAEELGKLPVQLQRLTLDRIDLLEESPSQHSRSCPPIPGPPNCQLSEFTHFMDGRRRLTSICRPHVSGLRRLSLRSLGELITSAPLDGWGEDPRKVEAVIKDDFEALAMFRIAMKHQGERPDQPTANIGDNETEVDRVTGTSRACTISRIQREFPELFVAVRRSEMTSNALPRW